MLLWNGGITVIDPGYGFMDLFALRNSMLDLRCVIVTHDHPDHCEDLFKILTLLREVNEIRNNAGEAPHKLTLLLSYGTYFRCDVLLQNREIAPYVDTVKVLPPLELDYVANLGYRFIATKCQHEELLGDSTTFGTRLELRGRGRNCVVAITSDTGYRSDIAEQFEAVDVLALHIGSMENPGSKGLLQSHLV